MKKLALASVVLFMFASSIVLVQISCSKINAQPTSTQQLNKVLFSTVGDWTDPQHRSEFWIMNYDGSNLTRIIPNLPAGVSINANGLNAQAALSPDGLKLFFRGIETASQQNGIYSCDISGNNVQRLTDIGDSDAISGAY
jgi:Tol biopolymer transport system component